MLADWQAIVPPSEPGTRNVRLADSRHPLDFRIGRDDRARYLFQLDAEDVGAIEQALPRLSGIDCSLESLSGSKSRLVLHLHHAADFRNFALMCTGLMLATEGTSPTSSRAGMIKTLEELHRWQEMLRRTRESLLSTSERIGLVGELLFLRDEVAPRVAYPAALRCWNGPGGHEQDFVIGDTIFEVKTQVVTADRKIRISSEDQLDPVQGRIFICNQGIAPAPASAADGRTLKSLAEEVREAAASAGGGAPDLLEIALLQAGYKDRAEYDEECWIRVDRSLYEVTGDFPRIERRDLRSGVEMVKYSIRVSDCLPFTADLDQIMGKVTP